MALEVAGFGVGAVLFVAGVWCLLRSPRLRPYRFLGAAVIGVTSAFWITEGRPYYVGGLFALCFAAASVELEGVLRARWRPALVLAYVVSAAVAVSWLPVKPISAYVGQPYSPMNMELEEFGWPQVAASVAAAYDSLSPQERAGTTIVTESYWQAAAIEQFRPDLPRPYSGARGFWYFGRPPEDAGTTLFVGSERDRLLKYFDDVRQIAAIDNGHDVNNVNQGAPIWVCRGRHASWQQLWPEFRHMTFRW
jgi:hypothetical protein